MTPLATPGRWERSLAVVYGKMAASIVKEINFTPVYHAKEATKTPPISYQSLIDNPGTLG